MAARRRARSAYGDSVPVGLRLPMVWSPPRWRLASIIVADLMLQLEAGNAKAEMDWQFGYLPSSASSLLFTAAACMALLICFCCWVWRQLRGPARTQRRPIPADAAESYTELAAYSKDRPFVDERESFSAADRRRDEITVDVEHARATDGLIEDGELSVRKQASYALAVDHKVENYFSVVVHELSPVASESDVEIMAAATTVRHDEVKEPERQPAPSASPASDSSEYALEQAKAKLEERKAELADRKAAEEEEGKRLTIHGETLEEEVTLWLEALTGEKRGEGQPFSAWLRDGRVLCTAANAIQPGICRRINEDAKPFKQMENITTFIGACRKLGVLEKDVFSTVDLWEAKNLQVVMTCIFQLGSIVRTSAPDFKGPFLGVRQNAKVVDVKRKSVEAASIMAGGLRKDVADEVRNAGVGTRQVVMHKAHE